MPARRREAREADNVIPMMATGDHDALDAREDLDQVAEGASLPHELDVRAEGRDQAADARDEAAEAHADRQAGEQLTVQQIAELKMLAARDRAAAALDRKEAALDRHRAAEYLRRTYRDELTGALHRQVGREQLEHEVQRAQRSGDELVIAFLDVVHLKHVNDVYGHDAGDNLLAAVGSSLHSCLRSYDVVVRYGGDEFVCALPTATLADASRRFEDVARVLAAAIPGASLSIGLAQLTSAETLNDVVQRADREMYKGRRAATASGLAPGARRGG